MDGHDHNSRQKRLLVPRLSTFQHAFRGIAVLVMSQPNARFHLLATLVVMALGFICRLNAQECVAIALAIGLVWIAEALNTSIEMLADVVSLDHHPGIRNAKDVAAGGVLLAVIIALLIGTVVFGPYLLNLATIESSRELQP